MMEGTKRIRLLGNKKRSMYILCMIGKLRELNFGARYECVDRETTKELYNCIALSIKFWNQENLHYH
jgi:hypothetical protein